MRTAPAGRVVSGAAEPQVGDRLGAYRITEQIARSGMGVIYKAEHLHLGRHVALKLMKPEMLRRPDMVRRFFREARTVNEIGHPNIVDIVDIVEDFDDVPPLVYMVMELLIGRDLRDHLRDARRLSPRDAVHVATQVADALAAAHECKVLHRDIKPENIYLLPPQSEGDPPGVKLLDFGVVKAFGDRDRDEKTDPGAAVGTPAYMAPEHVLGKTLDERADVYSLGLVIYEMLAGMSPFQSDDYVETLRSQVRQAPVPLSTHRPDVPPGLHAAVMRCLEKQPARRFQDMTELREALRESLPRPDKSAPVHVIADRELDPPPSPQRRVLAQPDVATRTRALSRTGLVEKLLGSRPKEQRAILVLAVIILLLSGAAIWWATDSGDSRSAASRPAGATEARRATAGQSTPSATTPPASVAAPDAGARGQPRVSTAAPGSSSASLASDASSPTAVGRSSSAATVDGAAPAPAPPSRSATQRPGSHRSRARRRRPSTEARARVPHRAKHPEPPRSTPRRSPADRLDETVDPWVR